MNIKKGKSLVFFGVFMSFIILSVVIPILLNEFILYGNSKIGTADSWLSFWGTWLGAIFGGFITIIGIYFTLESSNKQFKESINEQRQVYESDRDLNLMPYLKIRKVINSELTSYDLITFFYEPNISWQYTIPINLSNIGLGSAIKIKLKIDEEFAKVNNYRDIDYSCDLGVNESKYIEIRVYKNFTEKINFHIEYYNIIDKKRYFREGSMLIEDYYINSIVLN